MSPDDPLHLPYYRRPPELGGTGQDPVWEILSADLGPDLEFRADSSNAGHGFIEPVGAMTLDEYQDALAATKPAWKKIS